MDELIGELYVCFSDDQIDEVKDLLDKHPQLLQEKFNDDPWMVLAASEGEVKLCQLLLDRGVDVNEKGSDFFALESAIADEQVDVVQLLLKNGATPNLGRNLVHAINRSSVELATLLIQHDIDLNQQFEMFGDPDNLRTALDWCPPEGDLFDLLREAGALTIEEVKAAAGDAN